MCRGSLTMDSAHGTTVLHNCTLYLELRDPVRDTPSWALPSSSLPHEHGGSGYTIGAFTILVWLPG